MSIPLSFISLKNPNQAEALDAGGRFSTMTEAGTKTWPRYQVALLILDLEGEDRLIAEIGTVRRTYVPVATGWHRLTYQRQEEIEPLDPDALLDRIAKRFRSSVESRLAAGGALTPGAAAAVAAALAELRPAAADTLSRLQGERRAGSTLTGGGLQAAAQEADAVTTALDLAGIPRTELRDARPDGRSSFVELLGTVRTREDPAITYDSMRFLDFTRVDHPSGIVEFTHNHERLVVINVNRQPLEQTTGADLIYINETTASFVLVQYKSFQREGDMPGRLVYRPDAQLEAELERMRKIKPATRPSTHEGFRFHPGCCFLKFCKPVTTLDHPAQQLVAGFYLPIEYYDLLVASDAVRGPRGGIALTYEGVPRQLTNDTFVALVRGGWIGSHGATTKALTDIVVAGLNDGHSMTVAAASTDTGATSP